MASLRASLLKVKQSSPASGRLIATTIRRLWPTACCLVAIVLGAAGPASAVENLRETTSLQFVPADAAFYRACLRNREQLEAAMDSNAMKHLLSAPRMAQWLATVKSRWEDPKRSILRQWYDRPENQELVAFIGDALSHEVFWYGDSSFAELLHLTGYVNEAATTAQLNALRRGHSIADSERAAAYAALRVVAQDPKQLHVPAVIIGFKVTDVNRAQRQIARLEQGLRPLLKDGAQAMRRERIAGGEFLTAQLDGSMLPWDLVPQREMQRVDPELRRRVRAVLESKQAILGIGVRGNYVLVSLGQNNLHLKKLGQGPLLIDRPEMAPLAEFADRPLCTVAYVGEDYRKQAASADQHRFHGSFLFEEFLENPGAESDERQALDEQTRRELFTDLKRLTAQVSEATLSQGATLRFSYLTERGYEGYCYDWSQNRLFEGERPLTVLDHLGGEPLAFVAGRHTFTQDDYDRWIAWFQRTRYYFEKISVARMSDERRTAYANVRRELDPLLARLDRANRELLLPALRDGQAALVVDAPPPADEFVNLGDERERATPERALPWLQVACVAGVSDAAKLKQACEEYLAVGSDAWSRTRNFLETIRTEAKIKARAPNFQLPELPTADALRPEIRALPEGELFLYQLPESWNVDPRVAPNMALSSDFVAMSYLPEYSQKLLQPQPLQLDGPLADVNRPLAAASYLNFGGLLDALQPRLENAIERRQSRLAQNLSDRTASTGAAPPPNRPVAAPRPSIGAPRAPAAPASGSPAPPATAPSTRAVGAARPHTAQSTSSGPTSAKGAKSAHRDRSKTPLTPEEATQQLRFAFDLLRCFRGFATATYENEDAVVTHYEIRISDLAE